MATLASLMSLLTKRPSKDTFAQITRAFATWRGDSIEHALALAEEALAQWPDQDRQATASAWAEVQNGVALTPWWSLVRCIAFTREDEDIAQPNSLKHITSLDFSNISDGWAMLNDILCRLDIAIGWLNLSRQTGLCDLKSIPAWPLHTLLLHEVIALRDASDLARFSTLELLEIEYAGPFFEPRSIPILPHLRELSLVGCTLTDLTPIAALPALKRLILDH